MEGLVRLGAGRVGDLDGAVDWAWREHRWGVVFEVAFASDEQWETFRGLPVVGAALDAVPDPVNGLLVHRGRGGGAGALTPRRPKPHTGEDAIELPEPEEELSFDVTETTPERLDGFDELDDPADPEPRTAPERA